MTQEVQVTITLEVDASKSKEDIKAFVLDMEQTYTRTVSNRNRWEFSKLTVTDIKEESEIYGTEDEPPTNNDKALAVLDALTTDGAESLKTLLALNTSEDWEGDMPEQSADDYLEMTEAAEYCYTMRQIYEVTGILPQNS